MTGLIKLLIELNSGRLEYRKRDFVSMRTFIDVLSVYEFGFYPMLNKGIIKFSYLNLAALASAKRRTIIIDLRMCGMHFRQQFFMRGVCINIHTRQSTQAHDEEG